MIRRQTAGAQLVTLAALWLLIAEVPSHAAEPTPPKSDETPLAIPAATDIHKDELPAGALQRLGTVRFRHNSTAIAYSCDGKILAAGGRDNVIRLFDASTGREIRRLIGHKPRSYNPSADAKSPIDTLVNATGDGGVNSVAFSPDDEILASGGWDDTIRLWEVATGKEIRKIDAHKAMVGRVVFSPNGKVLASRGALDGTVRLWDPTTGTQLQKFVGLSNINPWRFNHDMALAISPDSKALAATARNSLVLFDIASGAELKRLPAHVYGITVAYSPDGKLLASGGVDTGKDVYSLRIWDVVSGKEIRQCELPKNEPPTYIAWDPRNNGQFAAVVAEDEMHIFDATTGKEVVRLKHYWPSRVIYAPDGKSLASAGSGQTIRHWNCADGKELRLECAGHLSSVSSVAITKDGKLAASGGDGVRLWNPVTGKLVRMIEVRGGVSCLAFDPDGKTLASGGGDRVVHVWDVETGKSLTEFKPHANRVCGLAFSNDGKLLATGDAQSTVRIFDVGNGNLVRTIDNKSLTENLALAFALDNKSVIAAGAWNDSSFLPKAGQTIRINGKDVKLDGDFTLNLQGVMMTRKEGNFVLQWDVDSGKEVRKFGGLDAALMSLAISADGKLVAGASKDGQICIWDAETGKERLFIMAHPAHQDSAFAASPALAFAPDGKSLASASNDHTVRLWDVATAKPIGQFDAPDCALTSIGFSKDGAKIITGSADSTVLIWDVRAAGKPKAKQKSGTLTLQ
jgi:WD40 repeat protein